MFLRITLLVIALILLPGVHSAQKVDSKILEELTTELGLTSVQKDQISMECSKLRNSVEQVSLKYRGEEDQNIHAMVAEIREIRQGYLDKVEEILTPSQFENYSAVEDQIMTKVFYDLASMRLLEVQSKMELTNDQISELTPIMGSGMKKTMNILFKNAGLPLTFNRKLGIAKELKILDKEQRESMEKILTADQLAIYDTYRAEMKNNLKQ